jgi:SAM-dependent methyltransferase
MRRDLELETYELEDAHWWYVGRRRIVVDAVRRLELPAGASVLDAGCGSGRNLVELARFGHVVGLEPSPEGCRRARARAVGEVTEGSVEALPFPPAAFDLAVALDVVEHVDDVRALRELRRVVRTGGHLLVTVPAYDFLWGPHDVANGHRRRYTAGRLVRAAQEAGWSATSCSYFNTLFLPAAIVRRVWLRRRGERGGRSELLATPGWLDPVLRGAVRLEAAGLRAGLRYPCGLSILARMR